MFAVLVSDVLVLLGIFFFYLSFDGGIKVVNIAILIHTVLKSLFFPLMFSLLQSPLLHQIFGLSAIRGIRPNIIVFLVLGI